MNLRERYTFQSKIEIHFVKIQFLNKIMQVPLILAIESSCDDTSVAIVQGNRVLSNIISSQQIHKKYGGVVPEAASRAHLEMIIQCAEEAVSVAGINLSDLNAIAATQGPGLMGSLIVGLNFAKGLCKGMAKPLITVHHLQAHALSIFMDRDHTQFPVLCMIVSGGHTQLVLIQSDYSIQLIGQTVDDAAGEAFDKIGKLLGLKYPAGPEVDRISRLGFPKYVFPKSKMDAYNFSFSGLKTAALYFLQNNTRENPEFINQNINDICASIQSAIIDMLLDKLEKAANDFNIGHIGISGGVSANSGLREKLQFKAVEKDWNLLFPKLQYCTDNAAMIGMVATLKYKAGNFASFDTPALARYAIPENLSS